jgi:ABC-type branched-subunit amino acid transport system ATPase component
MIHGSERAVMKANNSLLERYTVSATLLLLAAISIGCSSTVPNNPALERARDAYQRARQDPEVVGRAAVALDKAGQVLERAEILWTTKKDSIEAEHLAYLVEKRVQIARATARRRLAVDEIQLLKSEPK